MVKLMNTSPKFALSIALSLSLLSVPAAFSQKKGESASDRETVAKPMSEKERQRREKQLRKELERPFRKWISEDVSYIISDEERATFKRLQTGEEMEQFIEQFWMRRDPTPDTAENEFKEEHYRRIAYANERYASGIPGWKTDRGRIYITFGPPDEIECPPLRRQLHAAVGRGRRNHLNLPVRALGAIAGSKAWVRT